MAGDDLADDGASGMDYAEHIRTYDLFVNLFKYGAVFVVGCVLLLAFLTL